jgi:hypothetical protein
VARQLGAAAEAEAALRRVEHAPYGLRWLQIVHGLQFDLSQSLDHQVPRCRLHVQRSEPQAGRMTDGEDEIGRPSSVIRSVPAVSSASAGRVIHW